MPDVTALADIASAQIDLTCAVEFTNFIQISLDGVKFMRLEEGGDKYPADIVDEFDSKVIYITFAENPEQASLPEEISAFEVARELSRYGDIYVVKDSARACFVEFYDFEASEAGTPCSCLSDVLLAMKVESGKKFTVYSYRESLQIRRTMQ